MPNPNQHFRLALQKRQAEMNVLPVEKQAQIINALVEGCSVRATARLVGVEHKTVMRVLLRAGDRCEQLLNERMRRLPCKLVQVDELWTYVGKHERFLQPEDNSAIMGDQYVFVAMDSESKLIPCFRIGKRTSATAWYFMQDLEARLANRVQLTTDGFRPYLTAVESAFGTEIDYAMLVKLYENDSRSAYSPGELVDARPVPVMGNPKPHLISTSHIERQNLTIRMQLRRFARLTNAFSKKLDNLKAALAVHFAWYNFCRVHQTLRVTPAMESGISDHAWSIGDILA
jgi:IS1 family transposase